MRNSFLRYATQGAAAAAKREVVAHQMLGRWSAEDEVRPTGVDFGMLD